MSDCHLTGVNGQQPYHPSKLSGIFDSHWGWYPNSLVGTHPCERVPVKTLGAMRDLHHCWALMKAKLDSRAAPVQMWPEHLLLVRWRWVTKSSRSKRGSIHPKQLTSFGPKIVLIITTRMRKSPVYFANNCSLINSIVLRAINREHHITLIGSISVDSNCHQFG